MERKTYGYQFQMVQLIVRKTKKVEAVKVEKQPLNALQTERGSFMIQRNPLNHVQTIYSDWHVSLHPVLPGQLGFCNFNLGAAGLNLFGSRNENILSEACPHQLSTHWYLAIRTFVVSSKNGETGDAHQRKTYLCELSLDHSRKILQIQQIWEGRFAGSGANQDRISFQEKLPISKKSQPRLQSI